MNHCSFYGKTGLLNLERSLYDILLAGTDTVSAFFEWFVMYMTAFPDVQEKCNREVENVIGNRVATLEDRSKTHYLEATLQEISRHCPHLALTVQHYLTADTTVGGYAIPKGTQVWRIFMVFFVTHDEQCIFRVLASLIELFLSFAIMICPGVLLLGIGAPQSQVL